MYTAARLANANLQHDRNTLTIECQLFYNKTLAEILIKIEIFWYNKRRETNMAHPERKLHFN